MNTMKNLLYDLPSYKQYLDVLNKQESGEGTFTWGSLTNILDFEDGVYIWGSHVPQEQIHKSGDYELSRRCSSLDGFYQVTCEVVACFLQNCSPGDLLEIKLNNIHAKDINTVQPIFLLLQILGLKNVKLSLNTLDVGDFSLQTWGYLSRSLGQHARYSLGAKQKRYDLQVGGIYALHQRSRIGEKESSFGIVSGSSLVRVDEVRENGEVLFQPIPVTHTLEEDVMDFMSIYHEIRYLYIDLLKPEELPKPFVLSMQDFGFNLMFGEEAYLLTSFGALNYDVECHVLEGVEFVPRVLSEVDLLYYCLKQREIDFDEDFLLGCGDLALEDTTWVSVGCPVGLPRELIDECIRSCDLDEY